MIVQSAQLRAISKLGLQDDVDYVELLPLPWHIRVRVWYKDGTHKYYRVNLDGQVMISGKNHNQNT